MNRIKKREPVRSHTEGHTRYTHAVWPVPDASDRDDADMDEPADPDGSGREVHDVSHVPYRPWCRFCVMGRGLEWRHLTQSGDRDDDRPRVFADNGHLTGDSTPLLVAEDRRTGMTFAAAVSVKGGGDPHAARLLAKWIDGLGCQEVPVRTDGEPSICELIRRVRELRAEGTTTVDKVSPPGDSAPTGIAERAILTVGGHVRTTKAVVEEKVLEGRDAGPRLTADGAPRRSSDLRLHGRSRRTHTIQATNGAQVRHAAGRFR